MPTLLFSTSLTNFFNFHTGNVLTSENVHDIEYVHSLAKIILPSLKTQNIVMAFSGIHFCKTCFS